MVQLIEVSGRMYNILSLVYIDKELDITAEDAEIEGAGKVDGICFEVKFANVVTVMGTHSTYKTLEDYQRHCESIKKMHAFILGNFLPMNTAM